MRRSMLPRKIKSRTLPTRSFGCSTTPLNGSAWVKLAAIGFITPWHGSIRYRNLSRHTNERFQNDETPSASAVLSGSGGSDIIAAVAATFPTVDCSVPLTNTITRAKHRERCTGHHPGRLDDSSSPLQYLIDPTPFSVDPSFAQL